MKKWTSSDKVMKTGPSDENKSEPLTKTKIKRCIELMAVIQEEVGEAQKELNNIWFGKPEGNMEKFKEEAKQIVSPLFELLQLLGYSFELKEKVEWLLKEIEKEIKEAEEETIRFKEYRNIRMFDFWDGKKEGLIEAKNLVKKAFKGGD